MSAIALTVNKGKLIGADRLPRYFTQLTANGDGHGRQTNNEGSST